MTTCNAEYTESGDYCKHTHHCVRDSSQVNFTHLCACGHIWADAEPAKPESQCTCSIELDCYPDGSSLDREYRYIVRCPHCLGMDAEIQRLAAIGDKWKQYANDVTDAKNTEIQRLEVELEQKMTPKTQRMQAEIQRLKEDVAINDDFVAALEAKVKSLAPHGTCACDYDRPGDVCAHHSPTVQRLTQELMLTTTRWHERWAEALDAQERNRDLSDALKVAVEAIENAPHDTRGFGCRGIGDCNCWKAEALSRIQESGGGE